MKKLVAIIAYNEEKNIPHAVEDLKSVNGDFDIVLIDNGSTDNTVQVAKSLGIQVMSHPVNSGSSMGTPTAYFIYAFKKNYDLVCQFDGDCQHLASELNKIMQPVIDGKLDYVIGSRFITNEGFQSTFLRRVGINTFSTLVNTFTGLKITDVTSGFRCFSRRTIRFFAKQYPFQLYDINQMLLMAHYSGARIGEVPVLMKERLHGVSEFGFRNSIMFPIKGVINIVGSALQKSKIPKLESLDGN